MWTYTLCQIDAGGNYPHPRQLPRHVGAMTWHPSIGCEQLPTTFRGRRTAFPLSQIAIVPGCAACPTPTRTRSDAPKVTAVAGELRKCTRRLLKRAVRCAQSARIAWLCGSSCVVVMLRLRQPRARLSRWAAWKFQGQQQKQ